MKALDREILRLALPSILANITVPLVGLVDTAVAGHLHDMAGSSADFIGGISVGAMILNVIYSNFAFLRASTGGLTAQAYGRKSASEYMAVLHRGLRLSMGFALALLALQWPISRIALLFRDATPHVAGLAVQYILIRIWAAPATLGLMVLKGWFIGMQDSPSSMFTDLTVNAVNIAASLILGMGVGNWQGLGFAGIALGTVIAQWSGLFLALGICRARKRNTVPCKEPRKNGNGEQGFFRLNADLFVRSICMTGIYFGYTLIAGHQGETMLACANIMMNLLMLFSFFTDGFAYAAEALTGRFIGERNQEMLRHSITGTFRWSFGVAGFWIFLYALGGLPMLRLMTDDPGIVEACREFLPWLLTMPLIGCAAFTWDGVYIGATASGAIRNSMLAALAAFLITWFAGTLLTHPSGNAAIHLLMGAYFAHLATRAAYLTWNNKSRITFDIDTNV